MLKSTNERLPSMRAGCDNPGSCGYPLGLRWRSMGIPGWPVTGTLMDRINLWWFYALGEDIGRLSALRFGVILPVEALRGVEAALVAIAKRDTGLLNPPIIQSVAMADELLEFVRELIIKAERTPPQTATAEIIARGNRLWAQFQAVLMTELPRHHTYSVSQTLAWDTDILVQNTRAMLPDDIRPKAPPEALVDLDEAGRCIAFDVYTAAGFHIIRATEAVIRAYYLVVVGTLPKVKDRNWGAYTRNMGKCSTADPRILSFIDHIREAYRNPITHPEQRLSKNDAQILLGICTSAIVQMVNAIGAATT